MTCPRDPDLDPLRAPLALATDAYRDRFGQSPPVFGLLGLPSDLTREILAAVERGEPLSDDDLRRRLGMGAPPAGAEV